MDKLTDKQFRAFCELVYREAGINLTSEKRELLNARLAKRLRVMDNMSAGDYLDTIQRDSDELLRFLDAISTNHTFFFRESKSFSYLNSEMPNIWCAASSSGEEPYSLATFCLEQGFTPSIFATDISQTCLDKGRRAIYPRQAAANIPRNMLKAFFQKGRGQWEDYIRVKDSVRRLVHFDRFNLLKDAPPSHLYDIIFCRNVMIYFDNPTKETVVAKLCRALRTGGYFIIGGAESLSGLNHPLKYIEPSVYEKK
ncbi:MAG: protein-glutamate O-methyltransferase CheR [Pseudomonadota bacterium]